jgi:hypothetical protein
MSGTTPTPTAFDIRGCEGSYANIICAEVNEDEVDFLLARGYPLKRADNRSIAEAVSAYLADSVKEGA